jgi:hypothetical protein
MRHFLPVHALLAAAALLAADPAHGRATTSVTLSDFHIELTDLDPSDGVAPSLTFNPQSFSVAEVTVGSDSGFHGSRGDSAFSPVSASREVDGSGGAAALSGDPFGAGALITASAVADHGGGASSGVDVEGPLSLRFPTVFVLGPQSEATFSGSVVIDWSASKPQTVINAAAGFSFLQIVDGDQRFLGQDYVSEFYIGFGAPAGTLSGPLDFSVINASDAPITVFYGLGVVADAGDMQLDPLPVDEPSGAALLLAGVPWLLWRARRRR